MQGSPPVYSPRFSRCAPDFGASVLTSVQECKPRTRGVCVMDTRDWNRARYLITSQKMPMIDT